MLDSRIIAYNIKLKPKFGRNYLSASFIHYLLGLVNGRPYNRTSLGSRLINVGEYSLAMELLNFPEQISEDAYTKINFFVGKESTETFPLRDPEGHFESLSLPEGKNLCFKTHGTFLIKKVMRNERDEWFCILLLERRHICVGLSSLTKYLQGIDGQHTIIPESITTNASYSRRIRELNELKYAIVKKQSLNFTGSEGIGTLRRRHDEGNYPISKIVFKLSGDDSPLRKFIRFMKNWRHIQNRDLTSSEIEEAIQDTELVLVGSKNGEKMFLNLFQDLVLYNIKVEQAETREINTRDFFDKLNTILTNEEIGRLFDLAMRER
ncbi:hypothetical protein HYV83_01630 [Candidatus Woesearchaeota archaeon]|nr:hypothetical protein [Candidatus Woesearchaeota archaeon]